jgi:RNA polymerase sigma factor for flagellar operon FliA
MAVGPDDKEGTPFQATPEEVVAEREVANGIRAAIARLPDKERKLVEALYFNDLTLDVASKKIGLSKSWGSRLHARAIEALARDLKRQKIRQQ